MIGLSEHHEIIENMIRAALFRERGRNDVRVRAGRRGARSLRHVTVRKCPTSVSKPGYNPAVKLLIRSVNRPELSEMSVLTTEFKRKGRTMVRIDVVESYDSHH